MSIETLTRLDTNIPPLKPWETLDTYQVFEKPERQVRPDLFEAFCALNNVRREEDLGTQGPPDASISFDIGQGSALDHEQGQFDTLFGRDSLVISYFVLDKYPAVAKATILELARHQGNRFDPPLHSNSSPSTTGNDEEPGKILHEWRDKDDAIGRRLSIEQGWRFPFYGSVDSTPLFIKLIHDYCHQQNDTSFLEAIVDESSGRQLNNSLVDAISWIENRLDSNQEGLVEFRTGLTRGIKNQAWKDSVDSYHHGDGSLANSSAGVASVEVQAYTYDALVDTAELLQDVSPMTAKRLIERAAKLKRTIYDKFWTDEKGGYFVLGTDRDENGQLRQLDIRTSNMGHLLNSRLFDEGTEEDFDKKQKTVDQLFSTTLLAPAGIRTLANDEVRYRPGAYHNGSVWSWDSYFIAQGLERQGYLEESERLSNRINYGIECTDMYPEFIRSEEGTKPDVSWHKLVVRDTTLAGFPSDTNTVEQTPQFYQGWTIAVMIAMLPTLQKDGQ